MTGRPTAARPWGRPGLARGARAEASPDNFRPLAAEHNGAPATPA